MRLFRDGRRRVCRAGEADDADGRLRCGGVGEQLAPFAGDVKAAIGERLVEARFHSCVEYPVEESLFD